MLAAPGVVDVAYSDGVPLGFEPSWWEELKIEGYAPRPNENMNIFRNVVSPGYLPLMRIPIVDGRNFTDQDNENAPNVMIVNEAFVRRFFAGRKPDRQKDSRMGFAGSASSALPRIRSITTWASRRRRTSTCPSARFFART